MKTGDEIISAGGHRAYITRVSRMGDVDAISCISGGAILIKKRWIGITWKLTGNNHEGLRKVLEDICSTQNTR